jgi:3-deoxy-manno-octulosonate cytidylyltransferase (CMP-KDO synthetase)
MKKLIVIPARFGSTRLPGKPLRTLLDKPLIRWVYEKALSSSADHVLVATDDTRIMEACASFGAEAVMTSPDLRSGTDRVYEAISGRPGDLIVNLQGDEPFIEPPMIDALFKVLGEEDLPMATLCTPLTGDFSDPDTVKVVLDRNGYALYFSRSPIPYLRGKDVPTYGHIGVYGFTRAFLSLYVAMERGMLEEAESLEQLRVLEHGLKIKVLPVTYHGFGIDTEEDLKKAGERLGRERSS